jgi:hypothetical protein
MLSSGDAKVIDGAMKIFVWFAILMFIGAAVLAWQDKSDQQAAKTKSLSDLVTDWMKNLGDAIKSAGTSVGGGIQQGASNLNPVTALVNALFGSKADPTSDINNNLQAYALSQEQAEWATQFVEGVPQSVLPDHF